MRPLMVKLSTARRAGTTMPEAGTMTTGNATGVGSGGGGAISIEYGAACGRGDHPQHAREDGRDAGRV